MRIVFIVLSLVLLFSCKKDEENYNEQFRGRWQQVNIEILNPDHLIENVEWDFYTNYDCIVYVKTETTTAQIPGTYDVSQIMLDTYNMYYYDVISNKYYYTFHTTDSLTLENMAGVKTILKKIE